MVQILSSDVTVVSVCYKSDLVIGDMVRSVPFDNSIILVDNGNGTKFDNLPINREVDIIRLNENIGFGRGCNEGAKRVETSWILFLNPDARLDLNAINYLVSAANSYPDAAGFNPRIRKSDGTAYFKRRSYLLPRREYMKRGWPETDCQVPVLSGAAIFVSKRKFDEVGGFDPNIFLYHEDDDLSLRLRKLGPLMFIREAIVTHAGGQSSERSPEVAYFKAFHLARSRIYAGKKHGKRTPVVSTFTSAFFQLLLPPNWVSRRKLAKMKGYFFGLLSNNFVAKK